MKPYTWEDALAAIREGTQTIPTTPDGVPLVVVNAQYYELMEMMEALTTGYNAHVAQAAKDQQHIERLRKVAQAAFPGDRYVPTDGWVSVKDFLPTQTGEYMTYGKVMGVYPYKFSVVHQAWNADDENPPIHAVHGVTHWYPRPKPPVAADADKEG